jgi:transposase InsO family protein
MQVSASSYYAWRKRLTKPPCVQRKKLAEKVRNCYFENPRRYGARRISKALGKSGVKIGRRKVRRLMTEEGLKAIEAKAFKRKKPIPKGQRLRRICWRKSSWKNARQAKSSSATLLTFALEAAGFVIWQSGRIKSPDESRGGV